MRKVKICDTTLRDCEHFGEFFMSVREKVEIARQLERLGVDIIELSILSDAMEEISKELNSSVFSVACNLPEFFDIDLQKALSTASNSRVNLLCHESRDEGYIELLREVLEKANEKGWKTQITIDAASAASSEFSAKIIDIARKQGAGSICIYENRGYITPEEYSKIVQDIVRDADDLNISVKCKNDLGMAVANVLAGVASGAKCVECSILGLGTRAGNAALEQVVMALSSRVDFYDVSTNIVKRLIYRTSRLVSTVTGQAIQSNMPIVGDKALEKYETQIALENNIEPIRPEEVGIIRNNLVLGSNTSETVFQERVEELGYILSAEHAKTAYKAFIELAGRKETVTDKDIEAVVAPMDDKEKHFELVNFVINSGTMIPSTATVILKKDGEEVTEVAVGIGPVDASFKAVDSISRLKVSLDDFSLQSVTEGEDALGSALVKVCYEDRVYTGRGVSTDIVESAIRAYINAINKVVSSI